MFMCIWTAEVGKSLICEREPLNSSCVAAVLKDDVIIGHLATKTVVIVYTEKWHH